MGHSVRRARTAALSARQVLPDGRGARLAARACHRAALSSARNGAPEGPRGLVCCRSEWSGRCSSLACFFTADKQVLTAVPSGQTAASAGAHGLGVAREAGAFEADDM